MWLAWTGAAGCRCKGSSFELRLSQLGSDAVNSPRRSGSPCGAVGRELSRPEVDQEQSVATSELSAGFKWTQWRIAVPEYLSCAPRTARGTANQDRLRKFLTRRSALSRPYEREHSRRLFESTEQRMPLVWPSGEDCWIREELDWIGLLNS